jgi:hypothetical protein
MAATGDSPARSRVAFTYPDFSLYELARFFMLGGLEMQSVAVGWQVYEITKRPLDLGLVGLAQFLPGILLFLVSGHAVDQFDRRKILIGCYSGFALCSSLLLFEVLHGMRTVYPIYVGADFDWHRSIVQRPCQPRPATPDRSRRTFSQCRGMEQHCVSERDGSGAFDRRICLRAHQGSLGGLHPHDFERTPGHFLHLPD